MISIKKCVPKWTRNSHPTLPMNITLLSIMSLLTLAPAFGKETAGNHQMEVVKKPLRVETSAELPFP